MNFWAMIPEEISKVFILPTKTTEIEEGSSEEWVLISAVSLLVNPKIPGLLQSTACISMSSKVPFKGYKNLKLLPQLQLSFIYSIYR